LESRFLSLLGLRARRSYTLRAGIVLDQMPMDNFSRFYLPRGKYTPAGMLQTAFILGSWKLNGGMLRMRAVQLAPNCSDSCPKSLAFNRPNWRQANCSLLFRAKIGPNTLVPRLWKRGTKSRLENCPGMRKAGANL
jgi:hypothetical protein